mmetsp:Transcript_60735/g.131658  ORF Transcript_60735/g.131658 Transcript_60735/m.131658 type:complete len:121 (-) Transcript_60735:330-692(-)
MAFLGELPAIDATTETLPTNCIVSRTTIEGKQVVMLRRARSSSSEASTMEPQSPTSRQVTEQGELKHLETPVDWTDEDESEDEDEDEDDDDEEGFIGKPIWTYSGPSLEELLASEESSEQ